MCLGIVSVRLWTLGIMRTKTISQNGKFQANLNGIWTIFEYINLNNNKEAFDNSRGIIIIALCKIQRLSLFQKFVGED
jgi:hypothetical protein